MLKLRDFEEVKINELRNIRGAGSYTTHNGTSNGDYRGTYDGRDMLYVYADSQWYESNDGGLSFQ